MNMDDKEEFIEEYKDFWYLIEEKIAAEPILSDLERLIEHVLGDALANGM
jgi:hypothetical protein